MIVELEIFSGLPNPRWEVAREQASELRRALERLSAAARAPSPPGLGYRGVHVFDDDGRKLVTLFGGVAVLQEGMRSDVDRHLEARVLRTGRGGFDDSLLSEILAELFPRAR